MRGGRAVVTALALVAVTAAVVPGGVVGATSLPTTGAVGVGAEDVDTVPPVAGAAPVRQQNGSVRAQTVLVVDGDADGDEEYASIQAAVNDASDGDRVEVRPGTYTTGVQISADITLVAPDRATLDGSGRNVSGRAGVRVLTGARPTVEGFRIRGYQYGVWQERFGTDVTLRNVTVVDNSRDGVSTYVFDGTIADSVVSGNGRAGIAVRGAIGTWTITDTRIERNGGSGIDFRSENGYGVPWTVRESRIVANGGDGIDARGISEEWVVNDTVIGGNDGDGIAATNTSGGWTVRASTIEANGIDGVDARRTSGAWRISESELTDNQVRGVDATGADPDGDARSNWWGRQDGPSAGQCVGNVSCATPLATPPDVAGTVVVDGDADGDGEYATIGAAIDASTDGDRVEITPGTYREQVFLDEEVTLVAPAGATLNGTGIDGSTAGIELPEFVSLAPTVAGLRIVGYSRGVDADSTDGEFTLRNVSAVENGIGLYAEKSFGNWTVIGGEFSRNRNDGVFAFYLSRGRGSAWTISGARVANNGRNGIRVLNNDGDWTVANTTVTGNAEDGVTAASTDGDWIVRNSAVVGNAGAGVNAGFTSGNWSVTRSTLSDNDGPDLNARNADPQGQAPRNWWGQPSGPEPGQCVGNVTCSDPLTSPPARSAVVVDGEADGDDEYASIQAAIDEAADDAYIRVRPGRYPEEVTVDKNVTIAAPDGATLDGTGPDQTGPPGEGVVPASSNGTVGIEIVPGSMAAPTVVGLRLVGYGTAVRGVDTVGDWSLRNLTVSDGGEAVNASLSAGSWSVETSRFTDVEGNGVRAVVAEGDWRVRDTSIRRGGDTAVNAVGASGDWSLSNLTVADIDTGGGVEVRGADGDWTIRDSVVNDTVGLGIGASRSDGNWTIANTSVSDNDGGIAASDGAGDWTIRNSRIVANGFTGVLVSETTGDWTIAGSTVRGNAVGVRAVGADGAWSIVDARISDNDGDGVHAAAADGNWTIRDSLLIDNGKTGLRAAVADGAWAVVDTDVVYNDGAGISTEEAEGEWMIRNATLAGNDGTELVATETTGGWRVAHSQLLYASGTGIDATGAAPAGTATGLYWNGTDAGDRCVGNVDCSDAVDSPHVGSGAPELLVEAEEAAIVTDGEATVNLTIETSGTHPLVDVEVGLGDPEASTFAPDVDALSLVDGQTDRGRWNRTPRTFTLPYLGIDEEVTARVTLSLDGDPEFDRVLVPVRASVAGRAVNIFEHVDVEGVTALNGLYPPRVDGRITDREWTDGINRSITLTPNRVTAASANVSSERDSASTVARSEFGPESDSNSGTACATDVGTVPEVTTATRATGAPAGPDATVGPADGTTVDGRLYLKSTPERLFVGVRAASVDWVGGSRRDGAGESLREVEVLVDRDGNGVRSEGDLRVTATREDNLGASFQIGAVEVYRDLRFVPIEVENPTTAVTVISSVAAAPTSDGTVVELGIPTGAIEAAIGRPADGYPPAERVGVAVSLETVPPDSASTTRYYAATRAQVSPPRVFDGARLPRDEWVAEIARLGVDRIDLEIDHVELTQAVQHPNNSLSTVAGGDTLARAFFTHNRTKRLRTTVTFQAWDTSGDVPRYLGAVSDRYRIPPAAPAYGRASPLFGADLRLPTAWTKVEELTLRVSAYPRRDVDTSGGNDVATVEKRFVETYDPVVYRVPVNTGSASNPRYAAWSSVTDASETFEAAYPVADPTFVDLSRGTVDGTYPNLKKGNPSRNDLIRELAEVREQLRQSGAERRASGAPAGSPPPDQVYGLTDDRWAGQSNPPWAGGEGFVAYGLGFSITMAHEVDHNVGDSDWSRHVTNTTAEWRNGITYGCDARGPDDEWADRFDDEDLRAVGWNAETDQLYRRDGNDFMSYCSDRWTSAYRWKRLVDRFESFQPGQPLHPEYLSNTDGAGGAGLATTDQNGSLPRSDRSVLGRSVPTYRHVSGTLFRNGTGRLSRTFERPGPGVAPDRTVDRVDARVRVERTDGTVTTRPIAASFVSSEGVAYDRAHFSVVVPDNSTIRRVELVDTNGTVLDSRRGLNWSLTSVTVRTPDRIPRNNSTRVTVDVEASNVSTDRLRYRLLYSHRPDSGFWYPFGGPFDGPSTEVTLTDLPGGPDARFLLLVSDGLRTEFVTTDPFTVSERPPNVAIERPSVGGNNGTGVGAHTVNATVSGTVSLDAEAQAQTGAQLAGEALQWRVTDANGTVLARETGSFIYRFDSPGRYRVVVTATDPATELTASDAVTVAVSTPPVASRGTVRAFETALNASAPGAGPDPDPGVPSVLPGADGVPMDPDGDDRFEDVDGDGSVDYDDVVTLFEAFDAPTVRATPAAFDHNGNGRLDFADLVVLFRSI